MLLCCISVLVVGISWHFREAFAGNMILRVYVIKTCLLDPLSERKIVESSQIWGLREVTGGTTCGGCACFFAQPPSAVMPCGSRTRERQDDDSWIGSKRTTWCWRLCRQKRWKQEIGFGQGDSSVGFSRGRSFALVWKRVWRSQTHLRRSFCMCIHLHDHCFREIRVF